MTEPSAPDVSRETAPPPTSTTRAAIHAARLASNFHHVTGVHLSSISVDMTDDVRPEIYLTLDDPTFRVFGADLARAVNALGLADPCEGDGWRQYRREDDDLDVILDVWWQAPAPTRARRVRSYVRDLASAARRDWTLDAILLAAAAVGAATALAARRALR
jgi:hypothetical protein